MFGFFTKARKERFRRKLAARWEAISEFAEGLECTRLLRNADEHRATYATIKEWPEFQDVDWKNGIELSRLAFRAADEEGIGDYSFLLIPLLQHHAHEDDRECCPSPMLTGQAALQGLLDHGKTGPSQHYLPLPFLETITAYRALKGLQEQHPALTSDLEASKKDLRVSFHAMTMLRLARHATRSAEEAMETGRPGSGGLSDLIPTYAQEVAQSLGAPALDRTIQTQFAFDAERADALLLAAAFAHPSYEEIPGNCSSCLLYDGLADAWRKLDRLTITGLLSGSEEFAAIAEQHLHYALFVADRELYGNHRLPTD